MTNKYMKKCSNTQSTKYKILNNEISEDEKRTDTLNADLMW